MNLLESVYSKFHNSSFFRHLSFTTHHSNRGFAPLLVVVAIAIMAAAVPTTLILVQQEQDNRQEASGLRSCSDNDGCYAYLGEICHEGFCKIINDKQCGRITDKDTSCVSGICIEGWCRATESPPGGDCGEAEDCKWIPKNDTHSGRLCRDNKCQPYMLPNEEECYIDEQCLSNSCRPDSARGYKSGKSCQGTIAAATPTTRPAVTNTPTNSPPPTRSQGGVITTPGSTQIQARGSLGITVIANDTDYTLIRARIWLNENSPALEEFRAVKNSSSAYRWDIPNRVWSNLNSYQVHIELFDDSRVIYAKTLESFSVTSSPIILQYTIDLNDDPDEDPTLTPTPRNTGGGGGGAQPTIAPRLTAPGVGYCANHLRANSQPVGNPNCEINNASYDGKSPNPYCEQEFGGSTPYFFACPAPNNSDPIQPPPISEGEEPTCTGKSPCGGSECVIGYLKPRCGSGDSGDFLQSRQGTYCGNDYYDVYLCKDGTQDEFRNPSGDSACNSSPWCIAQASPVLSGSPTPTPASYALECPNDGNHICASSPNCDNRPSYSPKASGHQICSEYSRNSQPFCCQKN